MASQNSLEAPTPIDFTAIKNLTHKEAQAVDQLILDELKSEVELINKIGHYIIGNGGKRLRPMVLLLASKALNETNEHHITLATVIEFLHTATLLHDDVIDESSMRRGKESANAVWGNSASVLVGDFLYSNAFHMMIRTRNFQVMEIVSQTTSELTEGEILQLLNCHNPNTTEAQYLAVIIRKTAILFKAAARLAAIMSNATEEETQGLMNYGQHLGIAFQLIDDALDYTASSSEDLGKNLGDDLAEGKPTLPLIYAMKQASNENAQIIRNAIKNGSRDSFQEVYEVVKSTQAIDDTLQRADNEADKAIAALAILKDSIYKNALVSLAKFAVQRDY
ncbi:MAG: polyprenyl synthetase family protein [Methylococcales bacterium]|nr:polyprenyl synthetase family protein [Methylococcales bacterium]